jgi:acetyl-CoA carboxylase biotin carboxylase subunit
MAMFNKILVANRGEIALRVIRACKELGIRTVAIYSEIDAKAMHVRVADERVCVGPADNALSYRNIPNILSAAEITGADAIHPGYGFLAENPHFAEVCESVGLRFIGPRAEHIALMGDKAKAREVMRKKAITVVAGSEGVVTSEQEAVRIAATLGYPVMIKAAAGGGGRGLRVVNREDELTKSFQSAQAEAKAAFGDDSVYVEKYYIEPRHIEIQIMADDKGRVVTFGERDCSIQRRHQKLLEESPSPVVEEPLRRELSRVATEAARAVGYVNAGTVEFLLDKQSNFYFLEMNTRIQVEHPVTEVVTGIDLVKEQILIASGRPLRYRQNDIRLRGCAIECRINAECPETFAPSPGTVTDYVAPGGPGIRVDSALCQGCVVPPHYDSLVAKIIAFGDTREEAVVRMQRALGECRIEGIKTNIPLHRRILSDPAFLKGRYSTNFLEKFIAGE